MSDEDRMESSCGQDLHGLYMKVHTYSAAGHTE